jgi:uncharacterized membrane protein YhiD involved in acid resistance
MTFQDIIKSSYLEKIAEFSFIDASIALLLAFLTGLFIHYIYRRSFSGVLYSKPFNTSLILLTMFTTFIILAVTSNVVLSLGMVGALSIVRFRTAIKDPLDLVFLFWSIGAGIVLGAGMVPLAMVGSVFIGVVLLIFVRGTDQEVPYVLILDLSDESSEVESLSYLRKELSRMKLKSKTITPGQIEVIYEIRLKHQNTAFVNELASIQGVTNATLVSYNGEYAA